MLRLASVEIVRLLLYGILAAEKFRNTVLFRLKIRDSTSPVRVANTVFSEVWCESFLLHLLSDFFVGGLKFSFFSGTC